MMSRPDNTYLLNRVQVIAASGLSRATIDRMEKTGRFPQRVQLSPRRVAWKAEEIHRWIASRRRARETPAPHNTGAA